MAVTVEYQAWDSASYNWLDNTTSTAAPQQINDKLSAWVTAVNANASNTNKQVSIVKGPADSTSANYIGWGLLFDSDASGSPFYLRWYSSSTTNLAIILSEGFNDNGTNGNYGTSSGNVVADTTISWYTSGQSAEFSIAYDTANGQEFFCLGWRLSGSTSYSDTILVFKDSNGEWAAVYSDGAVFIKGCFYMPTHTTPQRSFTASLEIYTLATSSGYLLELLLSNDSTSQLPSASNKNTAAVTAANKSLYMTSTTSSAGYGLFADVAGGSQAVCMGYSYIWVVF